MVNPRLRTETLLSRRVFSPTSSPGIFAHFDTENPGDDCAFLACVECRPSDSSDKAAAHAFCTWPTVNFVGDNGGGGGGGGGGGRGGGGGGGGGAGEGGDAARGLANFAGFVPVGKHASRFAPSLASSSLYDWPARVPAPSCLRIPSSRAV